MMDAWDAGELSQERVAADLLARNRAKIMAAFRGCIRSGGGVFAQDPVAFAQCVEHSDLILSDTIDVLAGRPPNQTSQTLALTAQIGDRRASYGIDKRESLRAAVMLFDVATTQLTGALHETPEPAGPLASALIALNQCIAFRIGCASANYDSYLLRRVREVVLAERHRLARDIHDRTGNGVSVALRCLELYELHTQRDNPDRAAVAVAGARDALGELADTTRQVLAELRSTGTTVSLDASLKSFIDSVESSETEVDVEVNGDEEWAPPEYISELFLILREALRNAFAHARSPQVQVRVDIEPDLVRAAVVDEGIGFLVEEKAPNRHGLVAMRERVELLGGFLTLRSRPEQGTSVEVWIPLPERRRRR